MSRILLVEDDESLLFEVRRAIEHEGHQVVGVETIGEARQALDADGFDLIVLDWGLPDGSGVEFCTELRQAGENASILMLTGRSLPAEKVQGLDSGADDYLTKPFHLKELTLRVRSLVGRSQRPLQRQVIETKDLVLDEGKRLVTKKGTPIELTIKEFALLEFFMRNRDRVYSLDELLNHIWVAEEEAAPDTVRTHIKNLRKKLDNPGEESVIQNVHGFGYRFIG
ncbi:MAG: DNA-binding response regulator [Cyanobacteria bacterium PR.3.49]|jgi:DNA-binding response OmpR family regulator|nr:DNA-binding response regulator [Cyanobacteria bacterium PR.3.49]